MCWISYHTPVKKIATEDITCYKLFTNDSIVWKKRKFWFSKKIIEKLISVCMEYTYIPYKENPKVNLTCLHERDWMWDNIYHWNIEEGYHSYETLDRVCIYFHYKRGRHFITKCIIPKGSEYYINEDHEIVSSNIIVTDKIVK